MKLEFTQGLTRFYDTFISIIMSVPYPHEIDHRFVTIGHNI